MLVLHPPALKDKFTCFRSICTLQRFLVAERSGIKSRALSQWQNPLQSSVIGSLSETNQVDFFQRCSLFLSVKLPLLFSLRFFAELQWRDNKTNVNFVPKKSVILDSHTWFYYCNLLKPHINFKSTIALKRRLRILSTIYIKKEIFYSQYGELQQQITISS